MQNPFDPFALQKTRKGTKKYAYTQVFWAKIYFRAKNACIWAA
jgi:hypothetical protein